MAVRAPRKCLSPIAILAAAAAAKALACYDVTPVRLERAEAGGPVDASAEASIPACVTCVQSPSVPGPGCGEDLQACLSVPACRDAFECAITVGCFARSRTREAFVNCSTPCALEAGLTAGDNPGIPLGLKVITCTFSTCAEACSQGEVK